MLEFQISISNKLEYHWIEDACGTPSVLDAPRTSNKKQKKKKKLLRYI